MTTEELLLKIGGDSSGGQAAVQSLVDTFPGLGQEAANIGDQLTKAFEHPIDAISSLASTIQTELVTALGPEIGTAVEIGLAALTLLGGGLFELGQQATETGADIARVGLVSNTSVPGISNLKFALDATGGSLDQLNNVMFMFEKRMDTSSESVAKGLAQIGLSLSDIVDLSADQQILKISEAFRNSGEDVNRASAAFEIFGRQGREFLPELMQDLTGLAEKSRELGNTWTEVDATAAHEFEIATKTAAAEASSAWTQLGRDLAPVTNQIALDWSRLKTGAADAALGVVRLDEGAWTLINEFMALVGTESDVEVALQRLTGKIPEVNASLKGLADGSGVAAKGLKDWNNQVEANAAQLPGWQKSTDEMNAKFGTTAAQLSGVKAEAAKAEAAAAKYALAWTSAQDDINKIWDDAAAAEAQLGLTGLELQLAKLAQQEQNEKDAWQKKLDEGKVAQELFDQAMFAIDDKYRALSDDATAVATKKYNDAWQATQDDIDKIWQTSFDTRDEIALKGVALAEAKLKLEEDNEKASWRRKLDAGKIAQDQFDQALDAIDAKYTAKRETTEKAATKKLTDEISKLWTDLYDDEAAESLTATQKQIADVKKWYDDKVLKAADAGIIDQAYYDNLYAIADQKMKDITRLNDPFYKAHQQLQKDLTTDWTKFLDDVAGGFTKTFSVDIVNMLTGSGGFHEVWTDLWHLLEEDVKKILADLLNNVIQGFIAGAEKSLGGWIAGLATGSHGGFWSALLGLIPGFGGNTSTTPITEGHFDDSGNWVPGFGANDPGDTSGSGGAPPGTGHIPTYARGGVVPEYFARGGFPGQARGTDTQPIWATPGEGILNTNAMRSVGKAGLDWLNSGADFGAMLRGASAAPASAAGGQGDVYVIPIVLPAGNLSTDQLAARIAQALPTVALRNRAGLRGALKAGLGFSPTRWSDGFGAR